MTAQQKIDQIQAIYRAWLLYKVKLEQAQKDWQQSADLIKQLEHFYFDGEWQAIYQQIENGADLDLTTDGEYSVMSEDTLWNAICEHQAMLWQNVRFSIHELDKNKTAVDDGT